MSRSEPDPKTLSVFALVSCLVTCVRHTPKQIWVGEICPVACLKHIAAQCVALGVATTYLLCGHWHTEVTTIAGSSYSPLEVTDTSKTSRLKVPHCHDSAYGTNGYATCYPIAQWRSQLTNSWYVYMYHRKCMLVEVRRCWMPSTINILETVN